tara:strand:- start:3498 stop:3959 length:462 start_codon:yes stop_codon:yes gene_type:complete
MNNVFIFDLDDTILFHRNDINYDFIFKNYELNFYLNNYNYPKYIFTNGTYNHAKKVLEKMELDKIFEDEIYARDTINNMKPSPLAYEIVNKHIQQKHSNCNIIFADDNINNLMMAKRFGWNTIYINQIDYKQYSFVDEKYNTIIDFLQNFKIP